MTKLRIYNHPESPTLDLETDVTLEIIELMDDAEMVKRKVNIGTTIHR